MIRWPKYYHKVGHPGTIVVHQEELEDSDHHIDNCYIVQLCARRKKCQVDPTTNLTANNRSQCKETGNICLRQGLHSQGNSDEKK